MKSRSHYNGLILCVIIGEVASASASIFGFNRDFSFGERSRLDNDKLDQRAATFTTSEESNIQISTDVGDKTRHKQALKYLLILNDFVIKDKAPAWYAANSGHWSTLASLIRSGETITPDILELEEWNRLFHRDFHLKDLFAKTELVNTYSDKTVKVESVLLWACLKGYYQLTEFLIDLGVDLNSPLLGNSHLWLPLSRGNYEIVDLLLTQGADIEAKDRLGFTLLHTAAILDEKEKMLEYLIDKGLDVNVRANNGQTPLDVANGAAWSFLKNRGGETSQELENQFHLSELE